MALAFVFPIPGRRSSSSAEAVLMLIFSPGASLAEDAPDLVEGFSASGLALTLAVELFVAVVAVFRGFSRFASGPIITWPLSASTFAWLNPWTLARSAKLW